MNDKVFPNSLLWNIYKSVYSQDIEFFTDLQSYSLQFSVCEIAIFSSLTTPLSLHKRNFPFTNNSTQPAQTQFSLH